MAENAPMPMRATHTIHIIAHIDPQKRPYKKWHTNEKKVLGYIPYNNTAWFFPVLISVIDCHGTGAIFNLHRMYKKKKKTVAPELLLRLLRNSKYRWIIADDRAKEELLTEGLTVFYQQLMYNWAGEGVCQHMASTLEMLDKNDYPSYHDAIWALVPMSWRDQWTAIMNGMTDRRSLTSKTPQEILEQLQADGSTALRKALVAEAAVDNYMWRVAWLSGTIDPKLITETWRNIGKDWQDELNLLLRTRQDAWHTVWYNTTVEVMADAFERTLTEIKKTATERAEDLHHKRSQRVMNTDETPGIWNEQTVEDQAAAFQRIMAGLTPAVEVTPVLYRQLKARLFFRTRYAYNAPIRDAIRKHENRDAETARRRREMDRKGTALAVCALKGSARQLDVTTERWEREMCRQEQKKRYAPRAEQGQRSKLGKNTEETVSPDKSEPLQKKRRQHREAVTTLELKLPKRPELLPIPQAEDYDSDPDLTSTNKNKQAAALTRQLRRVIRQNREIAQIREENQRRAAQFSTELRKWADAQEKWRLDERRYESCYSSDEPRTPQPHRRSPHRHHGREKERRCQHDT